MNSPVRPSNAAPDRGGCRDPESRRPVRRVCQAGPAPLATEDTTVPTAPPSNDPVRGQTARLRVVYCPSATDTLRTIELDGADVQLGRGTTLRVSLDDAEASRLHARICLDPLAHRYRIGDAQSTNGTFVNGERIDTKLLAHADLIRMGNTLLLFEQGDPIAEAQAAAERAAASDSNVLLVGETGVGKERFARQIHEASGRSGPFVAVNCGALPAHLTAAELFGHTRGAFSGAGGPRKGLFATADQGTLMLDEVAELPREQQPALLRAIQEGRVRPLGADREVCVNTRIVAACQLDLSAAVDAGTFRADLFARLAQISLRIPPLRVRRQEVLPLFREFLAAAGRAPELGVDVAEALLIWHWPYNIRELQNLARTFAALTRPYEPLTRDFLGCHAFAATTRDEAHCSESVEPGEEAARQECEQLRALLAQHDGNITALARAMGKHRSHVYRWMQRVGLPTRRTHGQVRIS